MSISRPPQRAQQPIPPHEHRHVGPVAAYHRGRIELGLIPACFAPYDDPHVGRRCRLAGTVDLALIDLVMPVMNGRELATRIRAVEPGRAILFMTGYDDLSGSEDPFAQEMVIKKPFKLVELAAAVGRALPGRDGERPGWNVTPIRLPKKS